MEIGVSLYPDLLSKQEIINRVKILQAKKINLVFTSIQLDTLNFANLNSSWAKFELLFEQLHQANIKVSVDISKDSIGKFNIDDISDLTNVKKHHIYALRVDGGYSDEEIALFTSNEQDIKIEINASMTRDLTKLLQIIKQQGNLKNTLACHNFFPRMHTGLSWARFDKYNQIIKKYNVKIGSFVTTQNSKSLLCKTSFGVPTIEKHRYVDLKYQIEDYKLRDLDYIIISEDVYTPEDLDQLIVANQTPEINIYVSAIIDQIKNKIFAFRPDQPEFIRRCEQRVGIIEELNNDVDISAFSLTIDNVLNGRYSGEVQITLKAFSKAKYINLIGQIASEQHELVASELLINKQVKFLVI